MRKNINKLVAFAIGLSVISGSVIPAFAADAVQSTNTNNQNTSNVIYVQNMQNQAKAKPVLTLKDAISAAIDNSEKLALQSKQIKLYEDQADIQKELEDVVDSDEDDTDFPYDKLELMMKQSKEQREYMKDQIAQDITNKYNDLVSKQNALAKLDKQIEIKTKQVSDTELKKKLGMVITTDAQTAQNELQTLKNSKAAKEKQLKNSQDYFKVLTDKDVTQYSLEQDQDFESFRISGSEDEYFDKVIDKYTKYNKKILDRTKENLSDDKVDKPDKDDKPEKDDYNKTVNNADGTTSEKFDADAYGKAVANYTKEWTDYGTYLQNKFSYNSGVVNLDESKKTLKDGLKQSYASLLDMENSINTKKATIQIKNKELSNAKLKYDIGLMTKADYDTLVVSDMDLETDLRSTINSYNTLKDQIQKPWLLTSGASASGAASGESSGASGASSASGQ